MKSTRDNQSKVKRKIRKGDKVLVIAGNCKKMTGTVKMIIGDKAIVERVNVRKRHRKGQTRGTGTILQEEEALHLSNLALLNSENERIKVYRQSSQSGERGLYYKDGNEEKLYRPVKKSRT